MIIDTEMWKYHTLFNHAISKVPLSLIDNPISPNHHPAVFHHLSTSLNLILTDVRLRLHSIIVDPICDCIDPNLISAPPPPPKFLKKGLKENIFFEDEDIEDQDLCH